MWPWTRQDQLRTRVADLESELRRIRAEWHDVLDRMLRIEDRSRKRAERAEAVPPTPITPADTKAALRARVFGQRNGA